MIFSRLLQPGILECPSPHLPDMEQGSLAVCEGSSCVHGVGLDDLEVPSYLAILGFYAKKKKGREGESLTCNNIAWEAIWGSVTYLWFIHQRLDIIKLIQVSNSHGSRALTSEYNRWNYAKSPRFIIVPSSSCFCPHPLSSSTIYFFLSWGLFFPFLYSNLCLTRLQRAIAKIKSWEIPRPSITQPWPQCMAIIKPQSRNRLLASITAIWR